MIDLASLADLAAEQASSRPMVREFSVGNHLFASNRETYLMGVINLSADSWYRESVVLTADAAIQRGKVLAAQGASIIDLGAESSLAGSVRVDEAIQRSALLPIVRELSRSDIAVSVETYHLPVVSSALEAGASIINLTGSADIGPIFRVIAEHEAAVIICFVQGTYVREVTELPLGPKLAAAQYEYFARKIEEATNAGVRRIWIDPGLGFYYPNLRDGDTRVRYQMQTFLNTFRLRALGWPTCHALPHAFHCFEDEVRSAEPFFAVLALLGKTDLLRTHELTKVRGVLRAMKLG